MDSIEPWIMAAKRGESEALGVALESFRGYLLAVARGEMDPKLSPKGGISDLVQETFLEAHQGFDRFTGKGIDDLCVWLRGILMHRLANFRRHYRDTDKRRVDREMPITAFDRSTGFELADRGLSPSGQYERSERSQTLWKALDRLPEDHRTIIVLRHEERLSFGEIGDRFGISEDAASKRWMRALLLLRKELKGTHERR